MTSTLPTRALGAGGTEVSAVGLGCMGLSSAYGPADRTESLATLAHALDVGMTFLDTADAYGRGANEELLGDGITGRRDEVFLATKFGIVHDDPAGITRRIDGSPAYVRQACENSLRRLRVDHIDLYYQHRPDRTVPIEDTVGAMSELVEAGKVRHLGLSEASADTIRRAVRVAPIAALQSEWSLFSRDIEARVLPVCRELGIAVVPFSPLGRGMLTDAVGNLAELPDGDSRRHFPRFSSDAFRANLPVVDRVTAVAGRLGATTGQVALAWLLAQGRDVIPIPGTRRAARIDENAAATGISLTADDLAELDRLVPAGARTGDPDWVERDTPPRPGRS